MEEKLPTRKKLRLDYYDYSKEGLYFITICTKNHVEMLGDISNDKITLTKKGIIAERYIKMIETTFEKITIDEYVIMPNHIHIIISIERQNEITLSRIIKQYKSIVTKKIGNPIWQKSYYEHIIRDEKEYYQIKEYVQSNVANWKKDKYY